MTNISDKFFQNELQFEIIIEMLRTNTNIDRHRCPTTSFLLYLRELKYAVRLEVHHRIQKYSDTVIFT